MKVLVAEDEADMQKIICLYLKKAGYEVKAVSDGEEAFNKICEEAFDLLIIDWMMPRMNGIDLCKQVRKYALPTKIIMLTAKSDPDNEITGLTCGADDYIKKPFEPKILLLRIQKMFQIEELLTCGKISLNQKTQAAFLGREEMSLTIKEYRLLQVLLLNKGITLTREQLLNKVWGDDYEGDERTLDTHIRRLRGKIGKDYVTTYVGLGYRMEEPHE